MITKCKECGWRNRKLERDFYDMVKVYCGGCCVYVETIRAAQVQPCEILEPIEKHEDVKIDLYPRKKIEPLF